MRHWREMAIDEPASRLSRTLLRAWAWLAAASARLSSCRQHWRRARWASGGAREETYARCRSASGGRATATCRRRRDRPFKGSTSGGRGGRHHEPRATTRQHPPRGSTCIPPEARGGRQPKRAWSKPSAHPRPCRHGLAISCSSFKDRQRSLGVEVIEVDAAEDIPAAIAAYLLAAGFAGAIALRGRSALGCVAVGSRAVACRRQRSRRRTATRQACRAPLPASPRRARWRSLQAPTIR